LRDAAGLLRAQAGLQAMRQAAVGQGSGLTRRALEARNLLTVAQVIVQAALGREESRGAHSRLDFPQRAEVAKHSLMRRGQLRFSDQL
jgi:L-aspartate oxidase